MRSLRDGPLIELKRVSKRYGHGPTAVYALRDVDLSINAGEFVTIVGPSGSGKSSCLNILGCLDVPTSGTAKLDGRDISALTAEERARFRRDHLGFVFQAPNLIQRMSALRNVELPLIYRGIARDERLSRSEAALSVVGLAGRMHHNPTELSGGQQQRVAIARALVCSPSILIADEPTGALDSKNGAAILTLLAELNRKRGIAVIIVTHDGSVADRSPRLIVFQDGRPVADQTRRRDPHAA